jgi:hypothetical protein
MQPSPLSRSRTFLSLKKKSHTHQSFLMPTSSQPLASTNLLFVSMDLSVLERSYKWSYLICGLLCLASFLSIMLLRYIRVVACTHASFPLPVVSEHPGWWFLWAQTWVCSWTCAPQKLPEEGPHSCYLFPHWECPPASVLSSGNPRVKWYSAPPSLPWGKILCRLQGKSLFPCLSSALVSGSLGSYYL